MFVDSDSRFDPFGEVISIDSASLGTASAELDTEKAELVDNGHEVQGRILLFPDCPTPKGKYLTFFGCWITMKFRSTGFFIELEGIVKSGELLDGGDNCLDIINISHRFLSSFNRVGTTKLGMFGPNSGKLVVYMTLELVVEVEENSFHGKTVEKATRFVPLFDVLSPVEDSNLLFVVDDVDDVVGTVLVDVLEDGQVGGRAVFLF